MTGWVLGVDIGSGWAVGATAVPGSAPDVLVLGGDRRVPCTVVLTEDGRLLAGGHAHRAAGRLPDRAERDPRRYVGRSPMLLGGTPVAAADALAALLALFVAEGRRRHGDRDPARIALTHPAAWGTDRIEALRSVAAQVVPAADALVVPEPVAVAAHHGGHSGPVAVYDLGATSLDTAVVVPDGAGFVVAGPGGDPDLGGELFDQLVLGHLGEQLAHAAPDWWAQVTGNPDRAWLAAAADLAEEARLAREALTELDRTLRYVPGADVDVRITRDELDVLLGDDVDRSVRLLAATIDAADLPVGIGSVLVAGGAAVTPLVLSRLRQRFGQRVVPVSSPQAAAALGAAGPAGAGGRRARLSDRARPDRGPAEHTPVSDASARDVAVPDVAVPDVAVPDVAVPDVAVPDVAVPDVAAPARDVPARDLPARDVLARDVLDGRIAGGRLYIWAVAAGGTHRLARLDAATGRVQREIGLARLVGWVVTAGGILACERRAGGDLLCHVLDPDLRTVAEVPLPTRYRPALAADDRTAWAVLRSPDTRMTPGPGTGETGTLAVQAFPFGSAPGPVQPLGPAVFRYADPGRRWLDATAPGSGRPVAGPGGCVVVVGRPAEQHGPRQAVFVVGPTGPAVRPAGRRADPWLRDVQGGPGGWWTAGSAGLAATADLSSPGRLLLPGGRSGLLTAGATRFGLTVETADGAGAALFLLDAPARPLGRWAAVAGSPVAARAADAVAARADGDALLLGVVHADGRGAVVRAGRDGARELAALPGRLVPVGRAGGAVLARHVPDGDGERPGSLVALR